MLTTVIEKLFSKHGIVHQVVGNHRPKQAEYAKAIAESLSDTSTKYSIYNALGGIGKTMGYLLPAVMNFVINGKKSAIATTTISLRDDILTKERDNLVKILDLINKDADILKMIGKDHVTMPVIHCRKSKSQFISDEWLEANKGNMPYADFVNYFKHNTDITEWIQERGALPHNLTVEDVSLNAKERGRSYKEYISQRQKASEADIVLVTQAYLLHDAISFNPAMRDGERDLILDEAENVINTANMIQSNFVLSDWSSLVAGANSTVLQSYIDGITDLITPHLVDGQYTVYQDIKEQEKNRNIRDTLMANLKGIIDVLTDNNKNKLSAVANSIQKVINSLESKRETKTSFVSFVMDEDDDGVLSLRMRHWLPYENVVMPFIYRNYDRVILTSAHIIAPGGTIAQVKNQYGIYRDDATTSKEFKPETYGKAGVIWNGNKYEVFVPDQKGHKITSDDHIRYCAEQAVFAASHGQAVMLVPSYRDMDRIREKVLELDPNLMVYCQSPVTKPTAFADKFGNGDKFLILLITWEGVNYQGIDHLLISRTPRAPFDEERRSLAVSADVSTQKGYEAENAKRKLAQGIARGIRDDSHSVIFHICDPRLRPKFHTWIGDSGGGTDYSDCFPDRFEVEFAAIKNHKSIMFQGGKYRNGRRDVVVVKDYFTDMGLGKCFK